jgi:hypothetical protein
MDWPGGSVFCPRQAGGSAATPGQLFRAVARWECPPTGWSFSRGSVVADDADGKTGIGLAIFDQGARPSDSLDALRLIRLEQQATVPGRYTPMQSGIYKLRDGRKVVLRSVSVVRTYSGTLAGSRETVSKMVLAMLRARAKSIQASEPPLLLIVPKRLPLPDYRWTAELKSAKGVRTRDPDYGSHLSVCWFSKDLDESLDRVMLSVTSSLDWNANARDYDMTLI